jgi:hypothetical protein
MDPKSLPVIYRNNKKAWMTSAIFEDWITRFDKKMRQQNRHVLLFLDNAPSHPQIIPGVTSPIYGIKHRYLLE